MTASRCTSPKVGTPRHLHHPMGYGHREAQALWDPSSLPGPGRPAPMAPNYRLHGQDRWPQGYRPQAVILAARSIFLRIDWYMAEINVKSPSQLIFCAFSASTLNREKGESCWIRTVLLCKAIFGS